MGSAIVIMAREREGSLEAMKEKREEEHSISSIVHQARRRFMITDILSSVGNSIRDEEKEDEEDEEERKPSGGLDMRLLFPVLGGQSGHGRVDAESGEEADDDDGDDAERCRTPRQAPH